MPTPGGHVPPARRPNQAEAAPHQRGSLRLADLVAGALVVGVGVRQRQGGDGMPAHLAEDAPGGVARAGVDDHVPHQVDVDRVRREAVQQRQAVDQALHSTIVSQRRRGGRVIL